MHPADVTSSSAQDNLTSLAADAFARRHEPVLSLLGQTEALARASRDMAERFNRGGRLLVFGNSTGTTDAQHIAVEFVHPVIMGKRALPALSLVSDAATLTGVAGRHGLREIYAHQVQVLGRPEDIALGLSGDGECSNVSAGLATARSIGMLTVALLGADGGSIRAAGLADHTLIIASEDTHIVKEGHVTAYHLLWELVHVFFDSPDLQPEQATSGVEGLYPFLYGGGTTARDVLASAAESARQKIEEIAALRSDVAGQQAERIAVCAHEMASAFAAGATLLAFGNGGSSTDAHDIVHTFLAPDPPTPPLPALGLTSDVAVVTALSNDVSFDVVFARQVAAFGRAGDIAMALSTSGGSANVLAAIDEADRRGLLTVGMAGYGGGRMAERSTIKHLFAVSSSSVHRVQEIQTTIYHVLWEVTTSLLAAAPLRSQPARG
ncbi:MAG: hypothetical protein NVS3B26_20780 [Mycobacteriales bacterium]